MCQTQAVAKSLMTHREHVPQNVSYAITLDFYKFNPPKGTSSYRSYYVDPIQVVSHSLNPNTLSIFNIRVLAY